MQIIKIFSQYINNMLICERILMLPEGIEVIYTYDGNYTLPLYIHIG